MVDHRTDDRDELHDASQTEWDAEQSRVHDDGHTGVTPHGDGADEYVADEPVVDERADGGLYRQDSTGADAASTVVEDETEARRALGQTDAQDEAAALRREQADAERERLVAERAARREARIAALAPAPVPDPEPEVRGQAAWRPPTGATAASDEPVRTETVTVTKRSTDGFLGSLGLFLLRLVTAAIIGAHGLFHLLNLSTTTDLIRGTVLPYPGVLTLVLGIAEVAIAIALVFGLLTRVAGLGLALIAGLALAFVLWGNWSPFVPGQPGFIGSLELLLVGVGLLFFCVGGGGWAVDRGFRARRKASE